MEERARTAPADEFRITGPAELELDADTSSSPMAMASLAVAKVKLVTSPSSPMRMWAATGSPAGAASPLPRQVALWLGQSRFWHCVLQYLTTRQAQYLPPSRPSSSPHVLHDVGKCHRLMDFSSSCWVSCSSTRRRFLALHRVPRDQACLLEPVNPIKAAHASVEVRLVCRYAI